MLMPSLTANNWDSCMYQRQLNILVTVSSMDVMNYRPQPITITMKWIYGDATITPQSLLQHFGNFSNSCRLYSRTWNWACYRGWQQQMTALHILCANPHVTGDAIRVYLQLVPQTSIVQDSKGNTPFHYLCSNDIAFFDDRNFSNLMAWWW